jgi:uncharacterized protein DUF922
MKFLYALILTSLLAFTQADKKDLILWSPDYKLQWQDFKGNPQGGTTLKAMTWSTIQLETSKIDASGVALTICASFIKSKSWRKKDAEGNSNLLTHEQKHFDITEIYARKMRKKLSETTFTNPKQAQQIIQRLYNETFSESAAEQKKYDAETNHSINKEVQEKWNAAIETELQSLNAFSNAEVSVGMGK